MKKIIKKGFAIFLTVLITVSMWTVTVYAENSINVVFNGVNVILKEGITGENAASTDEDYSITVEVEDGCSLNQINVLGYGNNDGMVLSYNYDETGGVITVTKEHMAEYDGTLYEIEIEVFAISEFNAESDIIKVSEIPFEDEYEISEEYAKLIGFEDSVDMGIMRFYQIELEAGQDVYYKAIGTDYIYTDLRLYLAKYIEDNRFEALDFTDDNYLGMGEAGVFSPSESGTYVFIVCSDDMYLGESVRFELLDCAIFNDSLDFTQATIPTPDADDLWKWDASTKTLTLEDGFDILTERCSVVLPDGATLNVQGNVSVYSFAEDAICAGGDLTINLDAGATFDIDAGYGCIYLPAGTVLINGTPDCDGNLPVFNFGDTYGIILDNDGHRDTTDDKTNSVEIKNVNVNFTGYIGIMACSSNVNIDNCKIVSDVSNETVLMDCYDDIPEKYNLTIKNSVLDFASQKEAIQNFVGDVILEDCDTKIVSDGEEGIDTDYDLSIKGGRLDINSVENCLDADGIITLDDVNYMLCFNNNDGNYDIISGYDVSLCGDFIVYDNDMNVLYEGKFTDEIFDMFNSYGSFSFEDEDGNKIYPKLVVSTFDGKPDSNVVEGVLEQYSDGQSIKFTTSSQGSDIEYPVWAFERFKARTWEIVGTDLSGIVEDGENTVDISVLNAGIYTLRVRFEQQVYQRNYWAFYNNPGEDKVDYVDIKFKVLGESDNAFSDDEKDQNPDTGFSDFGLITVIISLAVAMTFTVKNKKTCK